MRMRCICGILIGVLCVVALLGAQLVADTTASSAPTFQTTRLMTWQWGDADNQVKNVDNLVVTRDGKVYVSAEGRIKAFSPDGSLLLATQPKLDRADFFAVDSKGCIYAIHGAGLNLVSKFDAQGKLLSDDPTEANGRGGIGMERLAFDADGNLIQGEILSFADRISVESRKHGIRFWYTGISIDKRDRLHVNIDERNPARAGTAIFDKDGTLVGLGPASPEPVRFDGMGRKYVFQPTDQAMGATLLMYSPQDVLQPARPKLPAAPMALAGRADAPLHGWWVDDAGSIYCSAMVKRDTKLDLGDGRVVAADRVVSKLDQAGHVLAQSPPLQSSPDVYAISQYLPVVDYLGRVYYLEFYADHTDVMRGEFK